MDLAIISKICLRVKRVKWHEARFGYFQINSDNDHNSNNSNDNNNINNDNNHNNNNNSNNNNNNIDNKNNNYYNNCNNNDTRERLTITSNSQTRLWIICQSNEVMDNLPVKRIWVFCKSNEDKCMLRVKMGSLSAEKGKKVLCLSLEHVLSGVALFGFLLLHWFFYNYTFIEQYKQT